MLKRFEHLRGRSASDGHAEMRDVWAQVCGSGVGEVISVAPQSDGGLALDCFLHGPGGRSGHPVQLRVAGGPRRYRQSLGQLLVRWTQVDEPVKVELHGRVAPQVWISCGEWLMVLDLRTERRSADSSSTESSRA